MTRQSQAVLLMLVGASLIPLGDAFGKYVHEVYGTATSFVAWSRFFIGALICIPLAVVARAKVADMFNPWVLFRGLLIAATISLILEAAARAPLADAFGAFFIAPTVSFLLAVVFLRERADRFRWIAVQGGFFGVLLIVRPSFHMAEGMVIGLIAGVFYGSFLTTNRFLSTRFSAISMMQAQLVVGSVVLLPYALPFQIGDPGLGAWIFVGLSAFTSLFANLLMIMAYARAEATRLAPLIYIQLVAATIYGWFFFAAWPDPLTFAGLAMLVGFGAIGLFRAKAQSR